MRRARTAVPAFVLAILAGARAYGDEPPSWQPFEVCSENDRFCAAVRPTSASREPWTARWTLEVVAKGSAEKLWSAPYQYDGYAGGLLSDDGAAFVYVNYWFAADSPVVTIYRADARYSLDGEAFAISRRKLQRTVSHRLWLAHGQEAYGFVDPAQLRITTIDDRSHVIDLRTGRLSPG